MTVQEIYIRTLGWVKYEDLTQEEINSICTTTAYHVFALSFHVKVAVNLITDQVYKFATWIDSGIRRGLRN